MGWFLRISLYPQPFLPLAFFLLTILPGCALPLLNGEANHKRASAWRARVVLLFPGFLYGGDGGGMRLD